MEIIVRKYENVATSLPRVHDPREVAARRRYEAAHEKDPKKREELLQSADEWSRSKKIWSKTDANGKPVFASKREVEEFQARTGRQFKFD
jgi:hypothetical protein